jgi:uncharacterized protein YndB with AHSA1/START domain
MTDPIRKPRVIELEIRIHAPRDAVWAALTEPSELARWFPPIAQGKPGVGEMLLLSWGPEVQWRTRIVEWEPGRHLRWQDLPSAEPGQPDVPRPVPMVVDWTLEATGGEVVVRLVQSGFGEGETWDDFYDGTDMGWRFFLNALRHYLERHRGMDRRMISVRRPARGGPSVPWTRLWSPEGFAPTTPVTFAPGKPFEVQLGGEQLGGTVDFVRPPSHFWGTVANLNAATLLVEMEPGRDRLHCGIWLSTYGVSAERADSLQRALTAMADRAFPTPD